MPRSTYDSSSPSLTTLVLIAASVVLALAFLAASSWFTPLPLETAFVPEPPVSKPPVPKPAHQAQAHQPRQHLPTQPAKAKAAQSESHAGFVDAAPAGALKADEFGFEEGEMFVAGTSETQLGAYMASFSEATSPQLEQRLGELEQRVAQEDYFRRANSGELDYGETMVFDDLLKKQEAIHLILLQRKLKRLARLTAEL